MSSGQHQTVSIGCGSLILIGLIVLLLGNVRTNDQTERSLQRIENRLAALEKRLAVPEAGDSGQEHMKQALLDAMREEERRRVRLLLPKYREIYREMLAEDPFGGRVPETLEELLEPLNRIIREPGE